MITCATSAITRVGRRTAEYVSPRGLGRFDAFSADDAGGQNKLPTGLKLEKRPDYGTINGILDNWGPYKGPYLFRVLLDHLRKKKYLEI